MEGIGGLGGRKARKLQVQISSGEPWPKPSTKDQHRQQKVSMRGDNLQDAYSLAISSASPSCIDHSQTEGAEK